MSLEQRAEKSKKEQAAKFAIPDANYLAKIYDWAKTKTLNSGVDQFVIKWKLIKVLEKADKTDDLWDEFEVKGKKIDTDKYGLDEDWKWTPLFDLLKKTGLDVSQCEEPIDMEEVLEELEDAGYVKCEIKVFNKKTKQGGMRKDITVLEVMPLKLEEPEEEEEEEAPMDTPVNDAEDDLDDDLDSDLEEDEPEEEEEKPKAKRRTKKSAKKSVRAPRR